MEAEDIEVIFYSGQSAARSIGITIIQADYAEPPLPRFC